MGVLKVIEIMSASKKSWEDATANAVYEASKTLDSIASVYVQDQSATVIDGRIDEYRSTVKITFHIVNHKSTVTNMKKTTKSKSHAAPKGVKKAAAKKAAPKKKAAAKKAAPKKKAAAKKAAPKKKAAAKKK